MSMRHRGIPMSRINPSTMKGPGDYDPPEEPNGPECPECGGVMVETPNSVDCTKCDYGDCNEPDDFEEPDYDDRAEAAHWGGCEGW